GVRGEQRRPAANAAVVSRALLVPIRAAERAFGAVLAGDVILLGRELRAPLRLALRHFWLGLGIGHDQPLWSDFCPHMGGRTGADKSYAGQSQVITGHFPRA